jgi:hypothetical protein
MDCCSRSTLLKRTCALALTCFIVLQCAPSATAQGFMEPTAMGVREAPIDLDATAYPTTAAQPYVQTAAPMTSWIAPPPLPGQSTYPMAPSPYGADPAWGQPVLAPGAPDQPWCWQAVPRSVIYHSYLAGVHEPRLGIVAEREQQQGASFWDGTLGARVGVLRYGTTDGIMPQGWELDVEAAAMVRLTLDEIGDFESADYRYGVPLTYGVDNWQFKFAAYHLSSHLGDEFAIANPGSLANRINYVRNELVLGASYFPVPVMRLYGELGWGFHVDGGAEPWEVQFGTELSRPGPTGLNGTPYLAINANLRQEVDWGGDLSTQLGWLWRNETGQVMRLGFHYYNGKSSQFQFFDRFEQQVGLGLWYDF